MRRIHFTIALALPFILLLLSPAPSSGQGEQGNVCVRDFQGGAVCTANDVRIEGLTVVTVIENCVSGTPGETEVVFETLVASGPSNRFDIGLFLALDGGSARDGDACYHDYLNPPLTATPVYGDQNTDTINDLVNGPWWDGDSDTCGDIEGNTQLFKNLPSLRFSCVDNNGDGSADVSVCTSWDNNAGTSCNVIGEVFPGTNSKCSCGGVELGIAPEPAITVVKTPPTQNIALGAAATFTFTVTSKTFISNVNVTDVPPCTTLVGPAGDTNGDSILTPDETWTYTCTIDNVLSNFMDTVTVTGDGPLGSVMDTDSASVTVVTGNPGLGLTKTGSFNDSNMDGAAQPGETITFFFQVANTGALALTNVSVSDPMVATITCPSGNPIPNLALATSETCTGTYTLTQADVDAGVKNNTATANSDQVGPVNDSTSVSLPAAPALVLTKSGSFNDESMDGVAQVGETLTYSFQVMNTGNQTLTSIAVSDPMVSPITCPLGNPIVSLAPGGTETCSGTYTLVLADITAGKKDNTATAAGMDPGGNPVSDNGSTSTPLVLENPKVGAAKRVLSVVESSPGVFDVAFELTVENLGNVALSNVQVVDDLTAAFPLPATFAVSAGPTAGGTLSANGSFDGNGDKNLLNAAASTLAPGASAMITFTVTLTLSNATGPFFNTALASGSSPAGTPVNDASDNGTDPDPNGDGDPGGPGENDPTPVSVTTPPAVEATKTSDFQPLVHDNDASGDLSPGDGLGYEVTVTNTSATDALGVVFSDTPDANTTLVAGSVTTTQGTVTTGNGGGDTSVSVSIGTLAQASPVVIAFEVTLVDPFPQGVTSILNQGLVSGSNFPSVPTDDPSTAAASDPTQDALGAGPTPIPALGTWAILCFALLLAGFAIRLVARS